MLHWIRRSVARRVALVAGCIAAALSAVGVYVIVDVIFAGSPLSDRLLAVGLVVATSSVLSVGLGTWLVVERLLGRRLRELTSVVRAAEAGKHLVREHDGQPDELGELGRAFDHLVAELTDLSVAVIDNDRELATTRRELEVKDALAALFEVTQSLPAGAGESELDLLLASVSSRVAPALGAGEVAVLLSEPSGSLRVRATHGFPSEEDPRGMAFEAKEGAVGHVALTRAPLYIPDTTADPRYLHYKGKRRLDGSFVGVPLLVQGRLIGVLSVLRPNVRAFSFDDVRVVSWLAGYVALSIAHAQAAALLHAQAVTDELTGVANRRQLLDRLHREIDRGRRTQRPVAALMLDLDHFKRVNDELGHPRGDAVLRTVAQELYAQVRRMDTVGRYGGEEFCVVLPDTARAAALVVAEKLREAVRCLQMPDVKLTVSIGVAVLPDDAGDAAGLIAAADAALLAAKRGGRDRVIVAGAGDAVEP